MQRLDAYIEHVRRTGDQASQRPELLKADTEFTQSQRGLQGPAQAAALALGLLKQGNVSRLLGDSRRAIALCDEAASVARRAGQVQLEAEALTWKVQAQLNENRLGPALADATQAVQLAERSQDPDTIARALDLLGSVQATQGDVPAAAETSRREMTVAPRARDPMAMYYALVNRSSVGVKSAEKCDYLTEYDACLAAADAALADIRQANAVLDRLGYTGLRNLTQGIVTSIAMRRQLIAQRKTQPEVAGMATMFAPRKPRDVLVQEPRPAGKADMPPAMVALLETARRERRGNPWSYGIDSTASFVEGMYAEMQGQAGPALDWYAKSIDTLERDRRSLSDDRARDDFMNNRIGVYYRDAALLLAEHRPADAFQVFERSRSRALADMLASRGPSFGTRDEQSLYAQAAALRARVADAQKDAFELAAQPGDARAAQRGSEIAARIAKAEQDYQAALGQMARKAPRLYALEQAPLANLADLQASMRAEHYETLQYMVTDAGIFVWHITPDDVFVRQVFLPRKVLVEKLNRLGDSLRKPDRPFDETTAGELFLFLVEPVMARVKGTRVVVIPHDELSNLPFEVLRNPADGRFLGERLQLSYAPSVTVLLGLRRSTPLAGARLTAMADPSLAGAVTEVEAIARQLGGHALVRTDALVAEKQLKALPADTDVLHLAVHGKFVANEPMLSHLKLAPGDGEDGQFTAAEMFGLPLSRTRLVVLSACESGRTESTHANEMLGVSRALLFAGANALLLSQWKVDSEATTRWMQAFYAAAATQPPAEAARLAARQLRESEATRHPFYWAPFLLIAR